MWHAITYNDITNFRIVIISRKLLNALQIISYRQQLLFSTQLLM